MKTTLTTAALILGTMASASVFAASAQPYQVRVFNLDKEAVVTITENGQPAKNVAVHVTGPAINDTYTTSESGTVFVRNNTNVSQSLKISVEEPNGQTITNTRFVAKQD